MSSAASAPASVAARLFSSAASPAHYPTSATWIARLPASTQPYLHLIRADRPIGSYLLLWPGLWSIALAAPAGALPDIRLMLTFFVGAFVMRGAGCIINDLADRRIDARVARTQRRPLASGELSPRQAIAFLAVTLSLGLAVLLQLNVYSIVLGASSLVLVCVYPLMKRVTFWPQAVLGLTFNWGALLGWSAARGSIEPEDLGIVLALYFASWNWTMVYDTIYAHQDKADDVLVGVKSTALRFGTHSKKWLTGFACAGVGALMLTGIQSGLAWPFYVGVAAASVHYAWQIGTLDIDSRDDCSKKFASNKWFGLLLFGGIVAAHLMQQCDDDNNSETNNDESPSHLAQQPPQPLS